MASSKYSSVTLSEIASISAVETPEVAMQKLNALVAFRIYRKASLRCHASHIRLLKAIRSGNRVHEAKEQSRYLSLRDERVRTLEAWLDTPLFHTAKNYGRR